MLRPCEFRRLESEWVCDAAGLPLKNLAEPGERLEDVCARCSIPREMSRRPCLFMTPVKVPREGAFRDLFACHWYHAVSRDHTLRGTVLCGGCRDWFPRPPREFNYRFLERTQAMREKMLQRFTDAPAVQADAPESRPVPRRPWWKRTLRRATAWL